jgi:hypothetical protein
VVTMLSARSVLVGGVFLLGACSQVPIDPSHRSTNEAVLPPPEFVARAIAMAMADQHVRTTIRDHMRASPMSEHKLQLQEYLSSPLGETLLAAVERSGLSRATFLSRLNSLPEIQFYVPARQQRLTWTGTADVVVSPNLADGAPGFGYSSSGATVQLHLDKGELPDGALFLLQRAEPMHRRVRSQGATAGNVIQDPADRDFGGGAIYRDAAVRVVRTVEFADIHRMAFDCGPEVFLCNEQGGGGGYSSGLYLTRLINHGVCDNACIFETLEFEFRTKSQYNATLQVSTQLTGIASVDDWSGYFSISPYRSYGQWVEVGVWETDSMSGDDPFECKQYGGGWSNCPNWIPRVQTASGGHASFALCGDLPWLCTYAPSDLEVTFEDRP